MKHFTVLLFFKIFQDIDSTLGDFVKYFKTQYLDKFPEKLAYDSTTNSTVDQKRLLKRIKDFYRAKGTEKAYRLLLRILNDATIHEFYYPTIDIIKSSTGKWITNKSIKTSFVNDPAIWGTTDTTIVQRTPSGEVVATATVRDVRKYETSTTSVAELIIDTVNGEFNTDHLITFDVGGTTGEFTESPYGVVQNIGVESGATTGNPIRGTGYKIGERITVQTATGGIDAVGEISELDGFGGIVAVDIINSGISYRITDDIAFDVSTFVGTGAGLTSSIGALTVYPGYYFGTLGQPSANKKLFDNRFYQEFSYELKTDITLKEYKKQVLDLIHPAGTKIFNQLLLKKTHSVSTKYKTSAKPLEISILGHYTPYTWDTTENLRYNSQVTDLYPFGHNPSVSTVDENATTPHASSVARSGIWWGQVYNDYAGRTGPSDTVVSGNTYAFGISGGVQYSYGSISGGTWDAGVTGPMYNLSLGGFFGTGADGSGASAADEYTFVGTADAGDFSNYGSYWVIYPHPNSRSINNIPTGCSFSEVPMQPFFYIDREENAGISTDFSTLTPT